ncbi:heme-dependent oxidative N-demethylase subunit alpha family protein [Croceicoccus bisphenolivorans]|uniref:heme-dependent oxidative N-demethylase subunit alpha family protein n=1 Tax=Croceicoccus bisphenolivorans TaxID=1783232 RepID=UPI0008363397|nr:heme-dependent oxidative N-demethylase subunit alpha family protein [Croceicoccus bisphenolivorans]
MTLGFSVETLLPDARVSGPLRMGLVRLAESEWLQRDPDLATRAAAFDAHPEAVQVLPEARAAEAELAAMLGVDGGLEQVARAHWEDFCILTQDAPGKRFRLTGAAVAFPTDWHLSAKMGRPMMEVHEPIDGYAEQLAAGVDRFLEGLRAPHVFGRTNAFVLASDALRYMPVDAPETRFAHVTAENAGETLFVRCERETLRRLPKSQAIVFTIGIQRAALGGLSDAAVARIAQSIDGFGEGEGNRRAAPHYAHSLAEYARQRANGKQAA